MSGDYGKLNVTKVLFIILTFLIYSASSIFSKLASLQKPLSFSYLTSLGGVVFALGVYAVMWQKVLSYMPLNKSFLFKSISVIIILVASVFIFDEQITLKNCIGASFVLVGLVILSWKK